MWQKHFEQFWQKQQRTVLAKAAAHNILVGPKNEVFYTKSNLFSFRISHLRMYLKF